MQTVTIIDDRGKIYKGTPIKGKKGKYYKNNLLIRSVGGSIHCGKPITTKIQTNLKGVKKS